MPALRAAGAAVLATNPLLSRRALQLYLFLFANLMIFVVRNQWMVSLPSSADASVPRSRHDVNLRLGGREKDQLGPLQASYESSKVQHAQEALTRDSSRRQLDRKVEVAIRADGTAHENFLPRTQDVIESIYERGRQRIRAELSKRENISAIEPFNPWGPVYVWDWFSPDYNCPTMERIGRVGDGGKWVCGVDVLRSKKCLGYSFGVNRDLSFELEMVERTGCEIHAFDPTVGGVPPDCKDNPHINFHKQALGPESGPTDIFMNVENLLDTMKRLGHTYIDVLKVDIEGSEWNTFKSLLPEKVESLPFGQLLIELHFRSVEDTFEFFDNMEDHGFRIFMRETNHNPCAAGKLPVAVEFSLINPQVYFSGQPEPAAVKAIAARPTPPKYNGVIYVLTHHGNMGRLARMLTNLDKNFNREYQYPVVIFHEDFTEEDKQKLQELVYSDLDFRTVSFSIPDWLDKSKIPERTPCSFHSSTVGYRHMNRFLAYFASKELAKEFDWQWRLDDDSLITEPVGYDVFDLMARNNKRYGFTNIVQDDDKCVIGLWDAAKEYVDRKRLEPAFFSQWREGAVFYNNFEISHKSVWTSPEYEDYFHYIDRLGGIYYHRWGDAPIRSIGVSLFVLEKQVHQFTDLAYTHQPFIERNATGLPPPSQLLFPRGFMAYNTDCGLANGTSGHGAAVHNASMWGGNGTCVSGKPSGVIYTVLDDSAMAFASLREMLVNLDKYFNDRFNYPVAVFAESLTPERRKMLRKSTRSVLEFYDLSFLEKEPYPESVDPSKVEAWLNCGFADDSIKDRKRNRYMAYEGTRRLGEKYDWLWRIAFDGKLTHNITVDPFEVMASGNKRYGYMTMMGDDANCVPGLWSATREYLKANPDIEPTFFHVLPENSTFYNGFEISHHSLWESRDYRGFYEFLDSKGGMIMSRWHEVNLHTLALSLFVDTSSLHRFTEIDYEHAPFIRQVTDRAATKKPLVDQFAGKALRVETAPDLSALLAPRRFGYLGSDVATSIRLPSHASHGYVWLLGDTFIGTSDAVQRNGNAHIVHNALAFLPHSQASPADVHFQWRNDVNGLPTTTFVLEGDTERMLWPVSGISVEYGAGPNRVAKLVLLAQRVVKRHDLTEFLVADAMNFEVEGTSVVIVDNPEGSPSRWQYRVAHMPRTNSTHNWFAAVATESGKDIATAPEEMLYLVGNVGTRGFGVFDEETMGVLAKVRVRDLLNLRLDEMEVFAEVLEGEDSETTVSKWLRSGEEMQLARVLPHALPELTLQYNERLKLWVAMEVDSSTAQLVLLTAKQATGPWTSSVIYDIPAPFDDLTRFRCYAGKGHPELVEEDARVSGGATLVFSYVCNSPSDSSVLFQEGQLDLYAPLFVRVHIAADAEGSAAAPA